MTTYALVTDDTIQSIGRLPNAARRLDTGEWVMGLDTAPPELVQATGWYEVVDTARPDDTTTTTHNRSIELVAGVPTVVWTERAKTADELASEQQAAQDAETRFVLQQAVPTLRQWAAQADGHTVTNGNAVATVQQITDNLALFYARFADLLEHQYRA